jgi:hypothetical protein
MKRKGAKGKYTPELVEEICNAISLEGSDRSGWEGRISEETFYAWLKDKSEFSEVVQASKAEYRKNLPEADKRQARKAFVAYLHGTMERVIITKETGRTERNGEYEKETVTRIPIGIPKWAIERVLGKNQLSELDALCVLVEAGWLPREVLNIAVSELDKLRNTMQDVFAGILPSGADTPKPGLTDETAAAIRAKILGIESLPPADARSRSNFAPGKSSQ